MPTEIGRDDVQRLAEEEGAQIVDVLPVPEYEDEHLSGAVSLPLKRLSRETAAQLDPGRPVIVYCHDFL